ncbi:hypothetical protein DFH09DRAFT_1369110 [Mycena vulgaris]|nr:hypothetical protein DFH09DRAFT_1369110 [Mycena vulgaris]
MYQFFQRLSESFRKPRTHHATAVNSQDWSRSHHSGSTQISEPNIPEETYSPIHIPDAPKTAQNVLKVSLMTLSSVACNIPFGAVLSSVIDPLLNITDRIEQTSSNTRGLIELATRIELLTPVVSKTAKERSARDRFIVDALNQELQSITKDLGDARSQGKFEQFFNSTDNASSLARHNAALTKMIADSTFVTVHEVLQSLHDLEESKFLQLGTQGRWPLLP